MKDLETRLSSGSLKPRKPLSENFTSKTIARLDGAPEKPQRRPWWKEYIPMRLVHKPIFAAIAVAVVLGVGGTTYAAVGGLSGVKALFGGQEHINGARIVKVDTQNCPHIDAFNITDKNRSVSGSYYYKIKADSKITNEQVVHMVQGFCEADAEGVANGKLLAGLEKLPENKDKLVGGYADSVITAVSKSHLSLRSVIPIGDKNQVVNETFTRIDPHVMVINKGTKESFDTLKVGDHVSVSYRASGDALTHSEAIRPDQIDYSAQTVVIITRISSSMHEYYDYQKYNGREFEQVTPCDKTTIGYCAAEQYNQK